jgi:release factor glutamine methyltransferase
MALDISVDAARVTRRNVERFELQDRVEVRQSDMFEAISELTGDVDAIVSSPPFISSGLLATGSRALLESEPAVAFDAGPYGIAVHQRLIREGAPLLRPGSGWLVVEFGEGQAPQVRRLIDRSARYAELAEYSESSDTFVACVAARRLAS